MLIYFESCAGLYWLSNNDSFSALWCWLFLVKKEISTGLIRIFFAIIQLLVRRIWSHSCYRLCQELGLLTKEGEDLVQSVLYVQSGYEINGAPVGLLSVRQDTLGGFFQLHGISWLEFKSISCYILAWEGIFVRKVKKKAVMVLLCHVIFWSF